MKPDCLPDSRNSSIAVLLVCALIMVFAVSFSGLLLNHDCALLLQCGRLISTGSVPFVDHVETNLHMAQYIHVPPVLLSNILGVDVPPVFAAGVLVFTFYSCFIVLLLVRRSGLFRTWTGATLIASSVLILSLKAYSGGNFGQREHLFLLAWLPFLFVRYSRMQDVRVSIPTALLTGFLTGILMLCKPSFFAQVVLIEVLMRVRMGGKKKYRSPEMIAVYSVVLFFAVHLLLLPGSIQSPFFTRWIPVIAAGYHSYNVSIPAMILGNLRFWFQFLGSAILSGFAMFRNKYATRHLLELLLAASTLAIGLFFLQHKGWIYHLFPAFGLVAVLITVSVAVLYEKYESKGIAGRSINIVLLLAPVAVCLILTGNSFRQAADSMYSNMDEFLKVIEIYSDPGERISFISTSVYPKYPTLVYADRLPGTRFMSAFPIALIYSDTAAYSSSGFCYRSPPDMTNEETQFLAELGMDIQINRPALVFICAEVTCQGCPPGFRIYDYLSNSGWLDEHMSDYEFLFTCGGFRTYLLN
ncbi:MAG: hypothetical protein K8S62_07355 [Candidatus Sabulitectum sp.]|nr:hypothetical protein [Candidatus Sabulitectum sp.]